MVETRQYHLCCKALENVYLEDSYVLHIKRNESSIYFDIEFVLTEDHQLYIAPNKNERYCYRRGMLEFSSCSLVDFQSANRSPSTDANGEKDLGNIDSFVDSDGRYFLEGCWGRLKVECDTIKVNYNEKTTL